MTDNHIAGSARGDYERRPARLKKSVISMETHKYKLNLASGAKGSGKLLATCIYRADDRADCERVRALIDAFAVKHNVQVTGYPPELRFTKDDKPTPRRSSAAKAIHTRSYIEAQYRHYDSQAERDDDKPEDFPS